MATDPQSNPSRSLAPANTATQSLVTALRNAIPAWVSTDDLDAAAWYMPMVKPGQGDVLRQAAEAHRRANAPSTYEERKSILRELRLGTMARNESEVEARASFEKLLADLADVPADILRTACKAYVNQPGTQFFPRGAGELRKFTAGPMMERVQRAYRLNLMAKESDKAFRDEDRCTPEQARQILAEEAANSPLVKSIIESLE